MKRALSSVLVLLCLVMGWLFLAPNVLGGSASYVTIKGISMEPHLSTGDVVVLRSQDSYNIGDAVAYRSDMAGAIVLHRIVGELNGRYILQGDNNDFLDSYNPTPDEVVGKEMFVVPSAATVINTIQTPFFTSVLVMGGLLLIGSALISPRRRNSRKGPPMPIKPPTEEQISEPPATAGTKARVGSPTLWSVIAILALVASSVVWFRPAASQASVTEPFVEKFTFDYTADLPANPVYEGTSLKFGEPIFRAFINEINTTVTYQPQTPMAALDSGTLQLKSVVTSSSGWARTMATSAAVPITSNGAQASLPVDFNQAEAIAATADAASGTAGNISVDVIAIAKLAGDVHHGGIGQPVEVASESTAAMQFSVTPTLARLTSGQGEYAPAPAGTEDEPMVGLAPNEAGASTNTGTADASRNSGPASASSNSGQAGASSNSGPAGASSLTGGNPAPGGTVPTGIQQSTQMLSALVTTPTSISLWFVDLTVSWARVLTTMFLFLSLIMLVVSFRIQRRAKQEGEVAYILNRYGSRIVPMAGVPDNDKLAAIPLATFPALLAISRESDRVIMHSHTRNSDDFYVADGGVTYWYHVPTDADTRSQPPVSEESVQQ